MLSSSRTIPRFVFTAIAAIMLSFAGLMATSSSANAAIQKCVTWDIKHYTIGNNHYGALIPVRASSYCNLYYGVWNSEAVEALQDTLNHCYGASLVRDGDYGNGTRSAVIRAQKKVGVTADGVYGPQTRSAMKWWVPSLGSCKPFSTLS